MRDISAVLLTSSGFLVLLIGLLCGAPMGRAINQGQAEDIIRAWRVAHSSLVGGGVMLLAISANLSRVELPATAMLLVSGALCVSVWAFTFALIFGAWNGHRGTDRGAGTGSALTYAANMTGVILSVVAITGLSYGACVHLLRALSVI